MGSVVDHSSQGLFFSANSVSVVQRSSQGRLFCFFLRILAPKGHILSKRVISVPDFLKIVNMLSDSIIFRVPSFRVP